MNNHIVYDDIDLYDLKQDPNELNNIYGKEKIVEIQNELKSELENLRRYYGDVE